ncbi:alpha 1,2-mannosyltransferase 2.4.1 [Steccherinum ochraceum]|uniref:Alpha 1,2-mannosyltransferase 2.4.1 n=1 Tax=Steccherinum ochraceum TaxID=92696 RepID=A0A4R0RZG9_9APHY|nr:alpha 1,2-mannosyltransferase 2.4.1 [Steccherinum ochraceum]
MMTRTRYVVLVLATFVSIHFILSFSHEDYGRVTSFSNIASQFKGATGGPPYKAGIPAQYYQHDGVNETAPGERANAAFVVLARNGDLNGISSSVRQMEDRFNRKFHYPYVFLNEVPFSDEFKRRITNLVSGEVEFGLIPREHWFQPSWIDEEKAKADREKMGKLPIPYGGSLPYRNMCRYNTGFFYRHELVQKYRYYWRIDPDVNFYCNIDYDVYNNKTYGFTISLPEYRETITTLWAGVKEFIKENPELVSPDNAMDFLSDDHGETYNRCHFWSNFEIGDLDLWRGEAYSKFFDFLDHKGGFYYERWGDAPVHSIGAALFSRKDQIHFFSDIGYKHNPFSHCPTGEAYTRGKCWCDPNDNFDTNPYSCLKRYDKLF